MSEQHRPPTVDHVRSRCATVVADLLALQDEEWLGALPRYHGCAKRALEHAVGLTLLARSGESAAKFVEHQVFLCLYLARLADIDRDAWPEGDGVQFGESVGEAALDVAVDFAETIRGATTIADGLPGDLVLEDGTDPTVREWVATAADEISMRTPGPSDWPDWKISSDLRMVRTKLDREYEAAMRSESGNAAADDAQSKAGPPTANEFRREGDLWTVRFAGKSERLEHMEGLAYIALLLGRPDQEIGALTLRSVANQTLAPLPAGADAQNIAADELRIGHPEHAPPVADGKYRASVMAEIKSLQLRRKKAEQLGQPTDDIDEEVERLWEHHDSIIGKRGSPRRDTDETERARGSVRKAISRAKSALMKRHPKAGVHISKFINSGVRCSYAPEPLTTWKT